LVKRKEVWYSSRRNHKREDLGMNVQETADRARAQMDAAHREMQGFANSGAVKANHGKRNDAERRYASAYQTLVRLGLEPQLRERMRP
jgi:hypothetical protein